MIKVEYVVSQRIRFRTPKGEVKEGTIEALQLHRETPALVIHPKGEFESNGRKKVIVIAECQVVG